MARIRVAVRFSDDPYRRERQRAYLAAREVTVLREAGAVWWVSATEDQLARFAVEGIGVHRQDEGETVVLPALAFDPAQGDPEPPAELAAPADHPYRIVLFTAPPEPGWLEDLAENVRDLPGNAVVCRVPPGTDLSTLDHLLWTGPYHPAYAVGFALTTRGAPFTAATLRGLRIAPLEPAEGGNLRVSTFDDTDPEAVAATIQGIGAAVLSTGGQALVVFATAAQVPPIARIAGIASVEPYSVPVLALDRSRVIVGTDQVAKGPGTFLINVDGAGEIAGIVDSGLDNGAAGTHPDLAGRVIGLPGMLQPDTNGHGTFVAGIIASDGASSAAGGPSSVVGLAPRASVIPQPLSGASFLANLMIAYRAGARAHNNSWEVPVSTGNQYQEASQELDRFCFTHPDMLVVFAAGNLESDRVPPGGDGVLDGMALHGEQVAKNILCVGATENWRGNAGWKNSYNSYFAAVWGGPWSHPNLAVQASGPPGANSMSDDFSEVTLFSARGRVYTLGSDGLPADTGRIRPHLVAPGTNMISLRSSQAALPTAAHEKPPAPLSPNRYAVKVFGTSFAAPHVTGAALLVRQYYRAVFRLLRRPRLLEEGAPGTAFVDGPAVCVHPDAVVLAWLSPVAAGAPTRLVANRATADLVPVNGVPVVLGGGSGGVGRAPAPRLARHGAATLMLYRQEGSGIRLRRLAGDLAADPVFGTVQVTTASMAPELPPGLAVAGDRAAVAWAEGAGPALRLALFDAATGTAVATAADLGPSSRLSPHGSIAHDGTHTAVAWIRVEAGRHRLLFRRVDVAGRPAGDAVVLVDQAAPLRDPHLAWDPVRGRYLVAWCDGTAIRLRFLGAAGAAIGAGATVVQVPAGRNVRRPYVAPHPVHGAVLVWEDDTQGTYDVYLTHLDAGGAPYTGIPVDPHDPLGRPVLRVSDTPLATEGFAASTAPDGGTVVVWHSADELNSDRRGVYAVTVAPEGSFRAQADPRTPLVRDGAYVGHTLVAHPDPDPSSAATVSACWAGGQRFLLRGAPQPGGLRGVELVRTNADGVPDGIRPLAGTIDDDLHSALWTGQRLVVVTSTRFIGRPAVRVLDFYGHPIPGLEPRTLRGTVGGETTPELAFIPGRKPRILVAYPSGTVNASRIRLAVLDGDLADTSGDDRELVPDLGPGHVLITAPHGWFHYVHERKLVLAAWADHQTSGIRARISRLVYSPLLGTFARLDTVPLTEVAGDSRHAVVAPRPMGILAGPAERREYLAAFEFRPAAGAPWEIRVSRLDSEGRVRFDPPAPAPPRRDVRVVFPGAVGWPAGAEAIRPQLACTFLDEPRADPGSTATPEQVWKMWSPGFGLAFLGRPASGGNRTLHFTLIDENGQRVPAAPLLTITEAGTDVLDFSLAWTGRHFWLTWVESVGGEVRHRQALVTRTGSRMAHDAPSAALVRATLVNGTLNLSAPPGPVPDLASGSGWGLLDLRQSLAPTAPVTFHAREDSVGPGGTLSYEFEVPAGTQVLRATLAWDDPPGPSVRQPITLHVLPPGAPGREYRGNVWTGAVSRLVPMTDPLPPVLDNVQQILIRTPVPGRYRVLIRAGMFGTVPEQQFPAQAVALVFVGSGREIPFTSFTNSNPPVV